LLAKYGDYLVRIRYHYDRQPKKRYKTVELIIEETNWVPPIKPRPRAACVWTLKRTCNELDYYRRSALRGAEVHVALNTA